MHELIYAMQFVGQATPASADGNVLKATTSAPSSALTTTVTHRGLSSTLWPVDGGAATFASEVTFTSKTGFREVGTIGFGEGYLDSSADETRKHGAVVWRIDDGDGQFAGATGLITSNFFVGEDLIVTDHHFGVIFLA